MRVFGLRLSLIVLILIPFFHLNLLFAGTESYRCSYRGFSSYSEIEIDIERPVPGSPSQNVQIKGLRFLGYGNEPSYVTSPLRSNPQVLQLHLDLTKINPSLLSDPVELSKFFNRSRSLASLISENGDYLAYGARNRESEQGLLRPYPVLVRANQPTPNERLKLEVEMNSQRLLNSNGLDLNIQQADHFALRSTPMRNFLNQVLQNGNSRLAQCLTCPLLMGYDPSVTTQRMTDWTNRYNRIDRCEIPPVPPSRACNRI